jgi:dihydroneopterin triphosphate diphosphatase
LAPAIYSLARVYQRFGLFGSHLKCSACPPDVVIFFSLIKRLNTVYKIPVSTLIVIYTVDLQVLLLERADHPGYWQSVTGSQEAGETLRDTAIREVLEETGLEASRYQLNDWMKQNVYEIYPLWRHRYPPGTTHNTEHVFGLLTPSVVGVRLAPREHLDFRWLPWKEAAEKCFSWSNRDAILELPCRINFDSSQFEKSS